MEWNGVTITDDMIEQAANDPALATALEDDCKNDLVVWIADHCRITNKAGEEMQLWANVAQKKLMAIVSRQQQAGKPIRIIILKARQTGMTTFGLGLQFYWCNTKSNHNALISAHDDDSCIEIFRKIQLFQEANPQKLPEQYSSRKEVTYTSPHRSSMLVKTAGKETLGRSTVIHRFHGSEVGFWPTPKKTLLSVLQCVPKNNPNTSVILESTANGFGGEFYDRCQAAMKGESEFELLFLPWHEFPEYQSKVKAGFIRTDEEQELVMAYGLSDEQLQWRRTTIIDDCGGDVDLFHQEFPSNPDEAFLVSGRPVFTQGLNFLHSLVKPPHWTGDIGWREVEDEDGHKEEIVDFFEDRGPGWVEIWEKPIADEVYAIGADTAEGLDPTETNDPDAHSAHVIRVGNNSVVAKVSGRFDPDLFGEQLDFLGRYYNCALLGVEVNNTSGGSVRSTLKRLDYPNLFYRERIDRTTDEPTLLVGWYTDRVTRGTLVADGKEAIREKRIGLYSAQTVHQLASFVYGKDGKPQATTGEHDDDVISLLIAWQMAAQAALDGAYDIADTAGVPANERRDGLLDTSMLIGGRELEPEVDEDEDDY